MKDYSIGSRCPLPFGSFLDEPICLVIESLVILPDHSVQDTPCTFVQAHLTRRPLVSDKHLLSPSKMKAPRKYMEEHGFWVFSHT